MTLFRFPATAPRLALAGVLLATLAWLQFAPGAAARHTNVVMDVDGLADGQTLTGVTVVQGWAADLDAADGTGIASVLVFLDGEQGQGTPLDGAQYGLPRPDVAATLGGDRFLNSGFTFTFDPAAVPAGQHRLFIYAVAADGTTASAQRAVMAGGAMPPPNLPPPPPPPPSVPNVPPPPPPPTPGG